MEAFIKLNNQTAGRDKIARLVQYLCRFLWHRLEWYNKGGVDNLKRLEFQLSTFRKLLRFGRCIDSVYLAIKTLQQPDLTLRITLVLSKLYNALFLFTDHLLWIGRADLYQVDTDTWGRFSNKYWLYSIVRLSSMTSCQNFNDILRYGSQTFACFQGYQNLLIDTAKNSCDLFIPLTALGHTHLSPGMVGLLGIASSLAGLISLLQPLAKLSTM
ncbi:hypothetical protein FQA39_LY04653 [Lamprigera yunnana]|nr:hypothetical protein FQA39_LY04653 [Lamprigera yunnana]